MHRITVNRKVRDWVSSNFLTELQMAEGINYHDLCIFLFMIKMSRGYEDERLILKIFLMFVNRADELGRFGVIYETDEVIDSSRMSKSDLRVLLMCILYL